VPDARTGPVGIGVIGAGLISSTYLENLNRFPDTTVLAIGDIRPEVAQARAMEHDVPRGGDVATVLDHPEVEIVVNLTTPAAHVEVAEAALAAGKHVWNEKPLALDRAGGARLLARANGARLRIGCAPDTFLGDGLQAARRALDDGVIGRPLTALALFQNPGPDAWHPNPAFLFQVGAGPLFDLGPYYLTALVQAFGPVSEVAAIGSTARATRHIGSGPNAGQPFDVTAPSHVGALIRFASGQSAQTIFSFDSAVHRTLLEINGTDGTMLVPDPNEFDGAVAVRRGSSDVTETVATTTARSTRGTGVLDMARAIRAGRPHRADGALAYHVLDVMASITDSIEACTFVEVESRVERAEPLPPDWDPLASTLEP
jgi:predicted dehydrogenase